MQVPLVGLPPAPEPLTSKSPPLPIQYAIMILHEAALLQCSGSLASGPLFGIVVRPKPDGGGVFCNWRNLPADASVTKKLAAAITRDVAIVIVELCCKRMVYSRLICVPREGLKVSIVRLCLIL